MTKREPTESRRRQIADAALKIIATHGVSRFTTSVIAHEVGMTEGALFRHFANKDEIVLAAIDRVEELFEEGAPLDDEGPPLERLRRFVEHRVRVVHAHGGIPRLVFSEELAAVAGAAGSARVQAIRRRAQATIRRCLEEAARRGELAKGLDLDATALVVQGAVMIQVFNKLPRAMTGRIWETLERALKG
jgi:AcrR family transcriptional regulator